MKILVCGAGGFVGGRIARELEAQGHTVARGVSARRARAAAAQGPVVTVDYVRDTEPAAWIPRLQGIDAVVNAVGVLRDSAARPCRLVHAQVPMALFEACARRGLRRVVQVSALGIEAGDTPYARTKREADGRLDALTREGLLDGLVLRPSVVFGRGGASTALFLNLARLPLLLLPRPVMRARVQPVHVAELAAVATRLCTAAAPARGTLACTGPEPVTLAGFIASLRGQLGHSAARQLALPDWLTRLSARAGDRVAASPWCSETLAMLGQDNVGDPAAYAAALGRAPTRFDRLVALEGV